MATDLLIPHTTRNSEKPGPWLCRHMWKWNDASQLKDLYIYIYIDMDTYLSIYVYICTGKRMWSGRVLAEQMHR